MKKCISVLALLAIVATGAFAQFTFSVGGGGLFDMSFGNGAKLDKDNYMAMNITGFGGFVFFDATYVEADVYFAYNKIKAKDVSAGVSDTEDGGSITQLGFSLLGKFPIGLGNLTVFPLVGISYNLFLSEKDPDGDTFKRSDLKDIPLMDSNYYDQFSILAGVGLNVPISSALYFRAEALLRVGLPTKMMRDMVDIMNVFMAPDKAKATLGFGPQIRLGIGYSF